MPILSITLRGSELHNKTIVLLDKPYNFQKLKLAHVYHNIDSVHFKTKGDKASQKQLFIRLGGLVDNHAQVINYTGDYETMATSNQRSHYNNADYQTSNSGALVPANNVSVADNTTIHQPNISIDHLIPIGGSKTNNKELVSRDLHVTLHDGGELHFSGELTFELFYMDEGASVNRITSSTGGIYTTTGKDIPLTFLTMVFHYDSI